MKDKTQKMRISDTELEILKTTFADRDELLKTIRNLFFGLPITDDEKKQIKDLFGSSPVLRKLMRKQFLPEIQSDLPLGQTVDLWMMIDLKDKGSEEIQFIVRTRKKLIEMIETSLLMLENVESTPVSLLEWDNELVNDAFLIARNQFISHTDQQLAVIKVLAGLKSETVEETKKKMMQDSSK